MMESTQIPDYLNYIIVIGIWAGLTSFILNLIYMFRNGVLEVDIEDLQYDLAKAKEDLREQQVKIERAEYILAWMLEKNLYTSMLEKNLHMPTMEQKDTK